MSKLNGNTLKYRVGQVEDKTDKIEDKVDLILTNHLPHIQTELEHIRGDLELNSWKIAGLVGLLSGIVSILGNKFL